ncbi:MAG: hybrid sensor histidine kinase/response regulator [Colwellia sp.]|nr:hybrid sensor histidine kinase/response regulator [Colwellia sp.]
MFNTVLAQKINKELIEKERFVLYMNEMLRNYIGSILVGLPLFYFIFQSQSSLYAVNIWFTFDAILMITALLTYYAFYQHYDTFHFSIWIKVSDIPLIVFSLHIALAPWLFLQSEADIYLFTLFIMIISLTGTVTHAIAYYFEKLVVFSTLPLLSLAVKFNTMESDNLFEVYIVLILVWTGLITFAHRVNKSLINSIILKFEHIQARANAERINAEKSQFMAAASHDIRQPLQAINLLVSTLKSGNKNPHDDVLFERLENSVDSMSELLNSMLDVSKLDAHVVVPKPQHICLTTLLEKLQGELEPFAKAKNINLVIKSDNSIVFSDVILLEQVLNNLLSNAIRYTHFGNITLSAQSYSGQINIGVKDTGVGIASADQDAIFLEFHQLHNPERDQNKGLGLGLSIVKRLCTLQNWPLSLNSELGVGSCFSFKVPKGDRQLIQVVDKVDMNKNLGSIDIIVIDDHEGIRFSLSNILSKWGCKVRSFESADNACEALKQLPTWKPNLIISDYRLRNNVTGIEAIDKVKLTLNYAIEAIVISGDTAPEEIIKIEKSGLIVLHKPIKPAKLRVVISRKMMSIIESNTENVL